MNGANCAQYLCKTPLLARTSTMAWQCHNSTMAWQCHNSTAEAACPMQLQSCQLASSLVIVTCSDALVYPQSVITTQLCLHLKMLKCM
jgi:hypothetical protein